MSFFVVRKNHILLHPSIQHVPKFGILNVHKKDSVVYAVRLHRV